MSNSDDSASRHISEIIAEYPPEKLLERKKAMELYFRRGASHAAAFVRDEVKRVLADGADPSQISQHIENLNQVLLDWRENRVEMPAGNPWDWSTDDLAIFIARRSREW